MDHQVSAIYPLFLLHPAVSTDSRNIRPGSIFFALHGESFNGNEFAQHALQSGAAYAIVDESRYALNDACILVDDVLKTLQALATFHRSRFNIPVIAITGTNGKTTTKELTCSVLSEKYRTLATTGNLNNHIGVPLTLLEMNEKTEIAIIEMGANHPGEIGFLCDITFPDYGLITNIGKAHLEGFGGFEGVVRTKTELYHFLRKHPGISFINNDDSLLKQHAAGLKLVTYGASSSDLVVKNITADPFVSADLQFSDGEQVRITSRLFGGYNAANIAAAACIGQHFGVPPESVRSAIGHYIPGNNRSQVSETGRNVLILDAYNANPVSMKAALRSFADSAYPEKYVILGDMLELGKDTDSEHSEVLEMIDQLSFSHVYLVGPVFTKLNTKRENICFQDVSLARMWLEHHPVRDATILIKGSRGTRLEKLVDVL